MKKLILIALIIGIPTSSLGQVRVLFSHQSVGRYVVGDPERAHPDNRATIPMRDLLHESIALWDHDYYNYSTDLVTPGTYVGGSLLDPAGEIYSITGFGSHRGSQANEVLMDHLIGEAFSASATDAAKAFRDSCLSRFDIVILKPGYHDLHMNTASSLVAYQSMLNEVSDWWHDNNPGKFLVVATASSMRHPSDFSGVTTGWPDTPEGHAEAESDVTAYAELDLWLENTWAKRHPENRHFPMWSLCVNHTGLPSEKFFTKDIFTGAGAEDHSGDNHLNSAGSDAIQAALVDYINQLAVEFENGTSAVSPQINPVVVLHDAKPNPFNPTTELSFEIAETSMVRLSIHDMSGRRITVLMDETRESGRHRVMWNGKNSQGKQVSSGVYFYRIEAGAFTETKRMALVK